MLDHRSREWSTSDLAFRSPPDMKQLIKKTVLTLVIAAGIAASSSSVGAAESSPGAAPPAPTLEQRVGGLEAYIGNTDPSAAVASLKDKDGNLPKDFKMAT